MVNGRIPSVFSKTYVTPRRPYEKVRLDQELKTIGEYGLRNKREVWRVKYTLAKIRKAARELLTLEEKDEKRLFQGTFEMPSSLCFFLLLLRVCFVLPQKHEWDVNVWKKLYDDSTFMTPLVRRVHGDSN